MGVEGRDKQKILKTGALASSGRRGLAVRRLRGTCRRFLSVRCRRDRSRVICNLKRPFAQAAMVGILKAAME